MGVSGGGGNIVVVFLGVCLGIGAGECAVQREEKSMELMVFVAHSTPTQPLRERNKCGAGSRAVGWLCLVVDKVQQ